MDPLGRLMVASDLVLRFMKFAVAGRLLGFNIGRTNAVPYYHRLLDSILVNKVPADWFQLKEAE